MDFSWSPQQIELYDTIGDFAARELNDNLVDKDRRGVFNRSGFKRCGEVGILGLPVPVEYGGLACDPLTTVGALERLGYACRDNGLVFSLNAQIWTATMPIVAFGTEEQKRKYLPGLCSGDMVGGTAMTEPGSGSDAYALRATAVKKGDRYVLNGSKVFVTNGPVADVLVVFARTDKDKSAAGISAFLVDRWTPGLTIGQRLEKMGLRTSPTCELSIDDCEVPEGSRLGREGAGPALLTHAMTWERGSILASAVGSMQRLLETCVKYAKSRRQSGRPIGQFQLVASRVVDMKLRLETARYMLYYGAWQRALGRAAILEAAMAKLHISESWVRSCEDAIQIHGGYGYTTDFEIERELRDAIGSRLYSGTSEIQRMIVASLML